MYNTSPNCDLYSFHIQLISLLPRHTLPLRSLCQLLTIRLCLPRMIVLIGNSALPKLGNLLSRELALGSWKGALGPPLAMRK